jgi:nucleotide-binding universal stress UspA family protein
MYKRILVPLDGSEFSECGLEHVKAIATGCNVPEVVLLRVIEPIPEVGWISTDFVKDAEKNALANADDYLAKLAETLKSEGVAIRTATISGKAADEIVDYASKNKVDLIIMSTHGSSGVVRWALGSVADRVLRHSSVPVLVAAPQACRVS